MPRMTGAEIAATRRLTGLSREEFARALTVRHETVRDWEGGSFSPRESSVRGILAIRAQHDADLAPMLHAAETGIPITLPPGPRPRGWYLALAARVIDRHPEADLRWSDP